MALAIVLFGCGPLLTPTPTLPLAAPSPTSPTTSPEVGKLEASQILFVREGDAYRLESTTGESDRLTQRGDCHSPNRSPDGRYITLVCGRGTEAEIYRLDADGGNLQRLTQNALAEANPRWSPDGLQIAYNSYRKEGSDLFVKKVGAISGEEILLASPDSENMGAWSKDGKYIAYVNETAPKQDIYILELTEEKKNYPFIQSPGIQCDPSFPQPWSHAHADLRIQRGRFHRNNCSQQIFSFPHLRLVIHYPPKQLCYPYLHQVLR